MKIGTLKEKIKKNRIFYFLYKKLTDHDYHSGLIKYYQGGTLKSKEKVKEELTLIKEYWKCNPIHYFRYRLYDKDLSKDQLLDYIPSYYFYNYYMPQTYKETDLSHTESKIKMFNYLSNKNIDTPETIGIIVNGEALSVSMEKISYEIMIDKLLSSESEIIFVKPDAGEGGKGIFTIKKNKGILFLDNSELSIGKLKKKIGRGSYILQNAIVQSKELSKINSSSVNTLRVITQTFNGSCKISAVVLRIGRNGSIVDNSAQGGISVNVDVDTGKLSRYAFTEHTYEKFEEHPDTKFRFAGSVIKNWDSIKSKILEYAEKAKEFKEIAWDIAVLDDRILVIEINAYYGLEHLQCCIGGMRRRLNVYPVLL